MDEFQIGQLTKEMVIARLKTLGDPCAAAAEIAKKTLVIALKGCEPSDAGKAVQDVCHGTMVGLLLCQQSLAKGSVLILEKVGEVASEYNLDPTGMMTWALRGLAGVRKLISREELSDIRHEIAKHFMGADEVFASIIDEGDRAPAAPPYI